MQRVERKAHRKNHFLFINSDSDDCASPCASPPPVYSPLKVSLDRAATVGLRGCNSPTPQRSSLEVLFHVISLQHVIILLRVLLLERSVLFLSSQYSLLTTVMEALKELLYSLGFLYSSVEGLLSGTTPIAQC